MGLDHIVIVGASLAGLRAAEELRTLGHAGTITLVGDEPHRPYERPPLSKQVLAGTKPPESATLAVVKGTPDDLDLEWRLGQTATGLDLAERSVLLGGGERLRFDGLVIATGASPKRLPGTDHLDGVHTLRSLDDCLEIRAELERSPRRVAVVGAGFIGAEVAATCRGLGIDVSLIEALPCRSSGVSAPRWARSWPTSIGTTAWMCASASVSSSSRAATASSASGSPMAPCSTSTSS